MPCQRDAMWLDEFDYRVHSWRGLIISSVRNVGQLGERFRQAGCMVLGHFDEAPTLARYDFVIGESSQISEHYFAASLRFRRSCAAR